MNVSLSSGSSNRRAASCWRIRAATFLLLTAMCCIAWAAEVMPPKPAQYFNDYAGVTSPGTQRELNATLEQFERDTSSQVIVAIYPTMQSASSVEDYANRIFQSWQVGQKGKDNGAVLFVFVQERRMRIEVGYGLEGPLPDALAKRIIEDEIAPSLRQGSFDAGMRAGVTAMLQAVRGEYRGTGRTAGERTNRSPQGAARTFMVILFFAVFVGMSIFGRRHSGGVLFDPRGRHRRRSYWGGGGWGGGWGSGGGGGGFGGGFSGGGGRSGGGGASGGW